MKFLIAFMLTFLITSLSFEGITKAQSAPPAYSQNKIIYKTITIPSGTTTSNATDIGGYTLVGFTLPATMTSIGLSWQVSTTLGGTYVGIYDSAGNQLSNVIAGGRFYAVTSTTSHGLQYIRAVAGANEAANRVITLHLKAI